MPRVLVVDDEPGVRESLRMLLKDECEVVLAEGVEPALRALDESPPDLVLLDLVMPGRSGLELLEELRERDAQIPVVVLTATRTIATAVEAMKRGAADYVTKPFEVDSLRLKVRQLLAHRALQEEVVRLRDEVRRRDHLGGLIGRSDAMQEVFRTLERVAASDATVLILGESGTGKELAARAVHELGPRRPGPFVAVNCAAIPDTLIESELFGHERGAFTGATERRIGKFEAADRGTLFLDEIGDLSPPVQAKLLRVLEQRTIERLGSTAPLRVDVRVICATNRDLERDVASGRFRRDLFYRIHVLPLTLPALRERRSDVRLLAEAFLERAHAAVGRGPRRISKPALRALEAHSWPGNVRELENLVLRITALSDRETVELEDLPEAVRVGTLRDEVGAGEVGLEDAVARFERELLREALDQTDWNQTRAAERLGITRRQLKLKIDRYGLTR
jgi:DNA-binding NtrC family response regulator